MEKKQAVAIGCCILALASCAATKIEEGATPIYFDREIGFRDISNIKPEVVAECAMRENLLRGFDKRSSSNGLPVTGQQAPRKLTVEIIDANPGVAVFGNLGSVKASLGIGFVVTEGDSVLLKEYKNCATNLAGFLGLAPTACNKIEKCARNQGEYVAERITRILYEQ